SRGEVPRFLSGRRPARSRRRTPARARPRVEARVEVGGDVARPDPGDRRVIDLKRLRDEPEYRRGIERKRVADGLIDEVLKLDESRRKLGSEVDGMRARQNAASKEIGKAKPEERQAKIHAAGELKIELNTQEEALRAVELRLDETALQLPNPADVSVP